MGLPTQTAVKEVGMSEFEMAAFVKMNASCERDFKGGTTRN